MNGRCYLVGLVLTVANVGAAKERSAGEQWVRALSSQVAELHDSVAQGEITDQEWVKARVGAMAAADQTIRTSWSTDGFSALSAEEQAVAYQGALKLMRDWDRAHVKEMKKLLKEHSWITISEFGARADADAWLVVQHADHDVKFQRQVLDVLTGLVSTGDTRPVNYAYLYDRVAVGEEKKQMFGTQGKCDEAGKWVAIDLADPDNVDARRVPYGMEPLAVYIQQASAMCR